MDPVLELLRRDRSDYELTVAAIEMFQLVLTPSVVRWSSSLIAAQRRSTSSASSCASSSFQDVAHSMRSLMLTSFVDHIAPP
jgi:hypothetical protein